jgi:hypothetical protein
VLAYFGYPQAREHDAESAGLALVEAAPKLTTAAIVPQQMRHRYYHFGLQCRPGPE